MGVWTHRQWAVTFLAWVLMGGLAAWRIVLGPWPGDLYRLAAVAVLYLLVRSVIVLKGKVPVWAEYGFLFIDATVVSAGVRLLGGLTSDFFLAYFFVLGEGALTLDLWLVVLLSVWVTLGYVLAVRPATFEATWIVVYRLFFLLLAGVGATWAAWREAAHGREVARLGEQLLIEEERGRLAREIHDGVGHILAAGTQSLELAERLLPTDPQRAGALLAETKRLLRQGLDEIRLLVLGFPLSGAIGRRSGGHRAAVPGGAVHPHGDHHRGPKPDAGGPAVTCLGVCVPANPAGGTDERCTARPRGPCDRDPRSVRGCRDVQRDGRRRRLRRRPRRTPKRIRGGAHARAGRGTRGDAGHLLPSLGRHHGDVHAPAARRSAAAGGGTVSQAAQKIRLLVADDESVLRHALTNLLAMAEDVEIVGEAGDGQEAEDPAARRR